MAIPKTQAEIDAAIDAQNSAHIDIEEDRSRITDLSALITADDLRELLRPSPHPAEGGETPETDERHDFCRRTCDDNDEAYDIMHAHARSLERRLRASQPVAEGVVAYGGGIDDNSDLRKLADKIAWLTGAIYYEGNRTSILRLTEVVRLNLESALELAHDMLRKERIVAAQPPEGGTLPPGAPEIGFLHWKASSGWVLHRPHACGVPSCVKFEIHPLGTRSSLRAADLGTGATTEAPKEPINQVGRCGAEDRNRRAWCVLKPGHTGRHQDSWGTHFSAALPSAPQLKGG